jgi:alpha-1,3-glucosyltransferase
MRIFSRWLYIWCWSTTRPSYRYNCVSLGMYTLCVLAIMLNHNVFACVCFVAAVNYKQMELYHALPLFVWMLASALRAPGRSWCARIRTLVVISAVTAGALLRLCCSTSVCLVTFAIIWYPFIRLGSTDVLHVLHRIFPLKRGVFEVSWHVILATPTQLLLVAG